MTAAKKPSLLLLLGTALVLLGGGAIAYWRFSQGRTAGQGMPTGVRAIPDTALLAVSFSTDPDQWQQARQLGTPATQAGLDQRLARWRDRWLTPYDLNFATHIAPWIGPEATLVWLPDTDSSAESETPTPTPSLIPGTQQRLMLLPIADPEAAASLATLLPAADDAETVDYRGVSLTAYAAPSGSTEAPETTEPATSSLWLGVLGSDLVLVTDHLAAAEQAIDAYRGERSLVELPGLDKAASEAAIAQPFGKVYVNLPAAIQYLSQSSQPPLPPAVVAGFQASQGLVASVAVSSQGFQMQGSSWLLPTSAFTYATSESLPAALPDYLPQDTLMMVAGSSFQQFWADFRAGRTLGALTALDPESLAVALQAGTGLTLEEDLLPWLGGEFALALLPSDGVPGNGERQTLPNPGIAVLAQVSDRPLAEQTFAQLDDVVQSRYRFQVNSSQREEITVTEWVSPFQSTRLAHGWLDPAVAFLTVGADTTAALVPPPERPLTSAPLFQLLMGRGSSGHDGHFYLNLDALVQGGDNLFLPRIPPEAQGWVQALRGVGVTVTVLDERQLRYDLAVALKQGDRPGPLPSAPPPSTPTESD